jgi:hypothetical protein
MEMERCQRFIRAYVLTKVRPKPNPCVCVCVCVCVWGGGGGGAGGGGGGVLFHLIFLNKSSPFHDQDFHTLHSIM